VTVKRDSKTTKLMFFSTNKSTKKPSRRRCIYKQTKASGTITGHQPGLYKPRTGRTGQCMNMHRPYWPHRRYTVYMVVL